MTYMTKKSQEIVRAGNLKREAFRGSSLLSRFISRRVVKSPDEFAQILHRAGYAPSVEKAKRIAPSFVGREFYNGDLFNDRVEVDRVMSPSGEAMYGIFKSLSPDMGL